MLMKDITVLKTKTELSNMNKNETKVADNCFGCKTQLKHSNDLNIDYCPNDCLSKLNYSTIKQMEDKIVPTAQTDEGKALYPLIKTFFEFFDENMTDTAPRGNHIALTQGLRLIELLKRFNKFLKTSDEAKKRSEAKFIMDKLKECTKGLNWFYNLTDPNKHDSGFKFCYDCDSWQPVYIKEEMLICDKCDKLLGLLPAQ